MSADLKKLYTDIIKSHHDAPFHFEKRSDATHAIKAFNPICGDRFEIFVDRSATNIMALHFFGFGCAISKASTSVLAQSIEGKDIEEALAMIDQFLRFINKEVNDNEVLPKEFIAFSGVHEFPERYDCATLSWREIKKFLTKDKSSQ